VSELKFKWRMKLVCDYHLPGQFQIVDNEPQWDSATEAKSAMISEILSNPKDFSKNYSFEIVAVLDGNEVQVMERG